MTFQEVILDDEGGKEIKRENNIYELVIPGADIEREPCLQKRYVQGIVAVGHIIEVF